MTEAPIWTPSAERAAHSRLVAFAQALAAAGEVSAVDEAGRLDYALLHSWSIDRADRFWPALWRFCGIVAAERAGKEPWDEVAIGSDRMAPPDHSLGPRWFLGARLNFAENLLRYDDAREALVSWSDGLVERRSLTYGQLRTAVAHAAAALRTQGIVPGDRVAGFLPNIAESVVAMLATTSVGAVWSSCSPDFGVQGVLDRFGQIAPRLLIAADGYRYAGKEIDTLERIGAIVPAIAGLETLVLVPYVMGPAEVAAKMRYAPRAGAARLVLWDDWLASGAAANGGSAPLEFARLPFDHPLFIMYSSGTTGLPKCMVHGAGGTILQHQKEHVLHTDLSRQDRIFYYTTCGWMMWNWLVSALAVGSTVVLYDGAPMAP
ncbi:MAG: AMP-binding protein, partial [Gemmatimonadaceae bacterium]